MKPTDLAVLFASLTTPHVADACLRAGVPVRCAPAGLRPIDASRCRMAGRVRPVRHYGSVDVFLEAIERSQPGEVLVIDNGGRTDEACVGDLVVLEAKQAGLAGMIVCGLHRDAPELVQIGLPLFSLGALPTGPLDLRTQEAGAFDSVRFETFAVDGNDVALSDENGVLFFPLARAADLARIAEAIRGTEQSQFRRMAAGESLRAQLKFREYLAARTASTNYTFREHLRVIGGAVEE